MTNQTESAASTSTPPCGVWSNSVVWFLAASAALVTVHSDGTVHSGSAEIQTTVAAKADAADHRSSADFSAAAGVLDRESLEPRQALQLDATHLKTSASGQRDKVPSAERRNETAQACVSASGIRVVTEEMESTLMVGEAIVRCGCR